MDRMAVLLETLKALDTVVKGRAFEESMLTSPERPASPL
jgi:hypothetical protein